MQSYVGIQCPVCEKEFTENDDIVTCPKCGAPYHRHCYFEKGACIFSELHESGKIWESPIPPKEKVDNPAYAVKDQECPRCGVLNHSGSIFCASCGSPLKIEPGTHANSQYTQPGFKYPPMYGGMPVTFDPMGGINPTEILDENINFGEVSKVVQQNTHYYMPVFNRIKKQKRGKFNFCAFLFSGGWLLYRKQYKMGIMITALMFALYLGQMFTTVYVAVPKMNALIAESGQIVSEGGPTMEQLMTLAANDADSASELLTVLFIPNAFSLLSFGVMLFVGFRGNRMYLKHCIRTVNTARNTTINAEDCNTRIIEKGGVNTSVILCLLICSFLLSYLSLLL